VERFGQLDQGALTMTEKKDELKAETLGRKMAEEFAANINRQVTEKPPQVVCK